MRIIVKIINNKSYFAAHWYYGEKNKMHSTTLKCGKGVSRSYWFVKLENHDIFFFNFFAHHVRIIYLSFIFITG